MKKPPPGTQAGTAVSFFFVREGRADHSSNPNSSIILKAKFFARPEGAIIP